MGPVFTDEEVFFAHDCVCNYRWIHRCFEYTHLESLEWRLRPQTDTTPSA